jgi:hypothetical protein
MKQFTFHIRCKITLPDSEIILVTFPYLNANDLYYFKLEKIKRMVTGELNNKSFKSLFLEMYIKGPIFLLRYQSGPVGIRTRDSRISPEIPI